MKMTGELCPGCGGIGRAQWSTVEGMGHDGPIHEDLMLYVCARHCGVTEQQITDAFPTRYP